jgi:hypothetical protein
VVKFQMKGAVRALPARSVTPTASLAVNWVASARGGEGVKVTTGPLTVNEPLSGSAPALRLNVEAVMDAGATASLKVAVTAVVWVTPEAPSTGRVETMAGGVTSPGAPPPSPPPPPPSQAASTRASSTADHLRQQKFPFISTPPLAIALRGSRRFRDETASFEPILITITIIMPPSSLASDEAVISEGK